MPKRPDLPEELAEHLAQLDTLLDAGDLSASEMTGLLRERRMTLNALESLVIIEPDTAADEVKAKREARRRDVAASAARAT